MLTYSKFMKEILTKKKRYTDDETIHLDARCNAIIQRTLPLKEADPSHVTIHVTIGSMNIGKTLIYLGLSINLIPLSVIRQICDLEMKNTRMTLQLAEKSITQPFGIIEDVLVKVEKFVFPINFVALNNEDDDDTPLVFGLTFMKTTRMMIDANDGIIKVRVQDEEVSFNIFETTYNPRKKGV